MGKLGFGILILEELGYNIVSKVHTDIDGFYLLDAEVNSIIEVSYAGYINQNPSAYGKEKQPVIIS